MFKEYSVCNIVLSIDSDTLDFQFWGKFSVASTNRKDNIIVFLDRNCVFNSDFINIEELNFNAKWLIQYENDKMLVCEKWEKARILPLENKLNLNTFLIQLFYTQAVKKHFILVHSSLVEYNGHGVMFLGPSGIGKTTQAELWHKYLDALIINGDMVFVEDKGDRFIGWGTPWHGSSPYCENTNDAIKAWIVLKQGKENSLRRLDGFEMVSEVSKNIIYPMWLENGTELALETLDHILQGVPVYELVNRADEESVMMVKQEVFGNEKD